MTIGMSDYQRRMLIDWILSPPRCSTAYELYHRGGPAGPMALPSQAGPAVVAMSDDHPLVYARHDFRTLSGRCKDCGKRESEVLVATKDDLHKSGFVCGTHVLTPGDLAAIQKRQAQYHAAISGVSGHSRGVWD